MVFGIISATIIFVYLLSAIAGDSDASDSYVAIFIYCAFYGIPAIIFGVAALSKGYKNAVGKSGLILGMVSIIISFFGILK
jgi:hypothetical protein